MLKKRLGLRCQTSRRLLLITSISCSMSVLETSQEITRGGGIGDALGAQEIEVGFVVAEQFQVLIVLPPAKML